MYNRILTTTERQNVEAYLGAKWNITVAKAQYNLGCAYYHGHGVPVDKAAAAEWYRKGRANAAELGYAKAQYSLGRLYCKGEGVPLDDAAGFEWNRRAAQQGYERAHLLRGILGTRHSEGPVRRAKQWSL
jgi:TPR repeat protein